MRTLIHHHFIRFSACATLGLLVGALFATSAAHAAGDPTRGAALSKDCASCHGEVGQAPIEGYPHLAGQKPQYLVKQLWEMRRSAKQRAGMLSENKSAITRITRATRSNETMDPFVINLSDQDISDLAAYYEAMHCQQAIGTAPTAPPKVEVRCRACHGRVGISPRKNIPNIAGQDAAYLIKQLTAFRAAANDAGLGGEIKRRTPIMASQAKHLTESDIIAMSEYYARLPCN